MTSFLIICRNAYILTLYKNNCKEIKLSVKARDTHPLNLEAPRYQRLSLFRCRIPLFGRSRAGGIGFLDRLLPAKSRRAKQFHSVFSGKKFHRFPISALPAPSVVCVLPPGAAIRWPCAFAIPPARRRPSAFTFFAAALCAALRAASARVRAAACSFLAPAAAPVLADSARPSAAFSWAGTSISPSSPRKKRRTGAQKKRRYPGSTRIAPHSVRIIFSLNWFPWSHRFQRGSAPPPRRPQWPRGRR